MRVTSVEELTVPIANVRSSPGQGAPEVSVAVAVMTSSFRRNHRRLGSGGASAAGAALHLDDVCDLVDDHREKNDRADDDEVPVGVQAPDALRSIGRAVLELEHVNAIVDDAHDGRADEHAQDGAFAAAEGAST